MGTLDDAESNFELFRDVAGAAMPGVIAFSSVCEEDVRRWMPQYLKEAERLGIGFMMNFDRCSLESIEWISTHSLCRGFVIQPNPAIEFTEQHKQVVFDKVCQSGVDWAMAWDVDETWEKDAPFKLLNKLPLMIDSVDCIDCPQVNLWDFPDMIRVDGTLGTGHRVKFYNLKRVPKWKFDHPITNGCKPEDGRFAVTGRLHLVNIHWGNMLPEDRAKKKERWDRIYSAAVGANPYGFWKYICDPSITPVCIPNEYL